MPVSVLYNVVMHTNFESVLEACLFSNYHNNVESVCKKRSRRLPLTMQVNLGIPKIEHQAHLLSFFYQFFLQSNMHETKTTILLASLPSTSLFRVA
jgi:hypothetical protein